MEFSEFTIRTETIANHQDLEISFCFRFRHGKGNNEVVLDGVPLTGLELLRRERVLLTL